LYSFRGFFVYFPFMYMYIFWPPVLRVLFITWYTEPKTRVRVFFSS
jgi:hypothetical protein